MACAVLSLRSVDLEQAKRMSEVESTTVNPVAQLRQLEELIDQINKTLVAQRELLRRHRLAMPPVILDTLESIKQDFKQLENKVLSEQTELQQLRALSEMSTRITTSLDVDVVLHETMELVIMLTNAERG